MTAKLPIPAIKNATGNVVGVRTCDRRVAPEKVLRALEARDARRPRS